MSLTRATSRALLKQQQGGHRDGDSTKRSPSITIDKLPEDILLEIFDFYRQCFEQMPNHERAWNGRNGWFILAHVCRNWRCVVLAAPSRLHLRLFFTEHTPARAFVLRSLPPLPIVIDYTIQAWNFGVRSRVVSLLRHSERVHRFAYGGSGVGLKKIFAMNRPFSALESLEIRHTDTGTLDFPAALRCSTHRLRRLKFMGAPTSFLSQLLSSTTGLTYLYLTIIDSFSDPSPPSPPIHLQSMPFLRFFTLEMFSTLNPDIARSAPPMTEDIDIFPLPELTHFDFTGHIANLEVLVAGLAAPSLKSLQVVCYDATPAFSIPHLSRFIRNEKRRVSVVNINFKVSHFIISMLHSIDDSPFKFEFIIPNKMVFMSQIGSTLSTLSATLATVEELLLTCASNTAIPILPRSLTDPIPWRGLLEIFCNVKILRIQGNILPGVAKFLEQDDGESALDLLPALEQIERHEVLGESQSASTFEWLQPFAAARRRAGCPVKVSWHANLLPPNHDKVPL